MESGRDNRTSRIVVVKDQVIPGQCEGRVMARMESLLGIENDLVEKKPASASA
jgi:hypothetical protein